MSNLKQLKNTVDQMILEGGKDWETVPVAYSLWTEEDVHSVADTECEMDETLTKADVSAILDEVYHSQDCEYGINWETILQAVENRKRILKK